MKALPKRINPPVNIDDYRRLHQVIRAVLLGANPNADPAQACVFYAVVGAHLLNQTHKLDAVPVAGGALYQVGSGANDVLAFARHENGHLISDLSAFHCWIECGGWVIDLMAPLFPDVAARMGTATRIPRQMFQRRVESMAKTPVDLQQAGNFYLAPNTELTVDLFGRFAQKAGNIDLVNVCKHSYRRTPKRFPCQLPLDISDGSTVLMQLDPVAIDGAW